MTSYSKLDQPEVLSHIFAPRQEKRTPLPANSMDIDIDLKDGTMLGCRFYKAHEDAPTIIYFHGNGETVGDYDQVALKYTESELNVFMTTYRGYGWSTGNPTVSKMFEDAGEIFVKVKQWLSEQGISDRLFVMGRSLGSAAAIDLVEKNQDTIKGLVIESGFSDTLPLAENLGIDIEKTSLTEEECFNNSDKIANIKTPTYILHGARDEIIPASLAEKLQSLSGARNKQFVVIPGADHNSMIETGGHLYFQVIKKFIDTVCGQHEWQYRSRKFKQYKESKK